MAGCGGEDEEDEEEAVGPGETQDAYLGLGAMKAGSWAEHTSTAGVRIRWEYLGEDTYNGSACFLMESETDSDGQKVINQIWIDKAKGEAVLSVMEMAGLVMKMDMSQAPEVPGGVSGETFSGAQQIGTQDYTTPTGKTVQAAAFKVDNSEQWISGQVPFGVVKSILDGQMSMELYDFGSSGAVRDISKEEAENATSFGIPGVDIPEIPGL
jgi:hypothetical protein